MFDCSDLEDGLILQNTHYEEHTWQTPLFTESASWALLSLKNAISGIQMDAGGYATLAECVLGRKVWILGSDPNNGVPHKRGFEAGRSIWYPIVMNKGDQL